MQIIDVLLLKNMEYFNILIFLIISFALAIILMILSFTLADKIDDTEKLSAYECGFNPKENFEARSKIDIRFYLVGILFIIFDLEITFLFPWSMVFTMVDVSSFIAMMYFLVLLTVGFLYEWVNGALDWE